MLNLYHGKSSPRICATSVIFKEVPKVSIHPMGENYPNLVTLNTEDFFSLRGSVIPFPADFLLMAGSNKMPIQGITIIISPPYHQNT
jgi:hypothetical protein